MPISTDALAEAYYSDRDPQNRNEDQELMRQLLEEVEGLYDDAEGTMNSLQNMAKTYSLQRNRQVMEALSGFDQALDALDALKGEVLSEISDF